MSIKTLLYGLGLGAGAMYLFDPERGHRRRALMRDQVIRSLNRTDDTIGKGGRDLSNRAAGTIAEIKAAISGEEIEDQVLAERVRSKIGRRLSHRRAIQVTAQDGRIILSGPILTSDVTSLITRVATVRGVRGIDNQLEVHDRPDVPALQGAGVQTSAERTNEQWSPGARLIAATAGGMIAFTGWRRGGIMGRTRSLIGLSLLARGVSNRGLGHLIGVSGEPGAVTVHKSIKINAPVEDVFRFWQNYENFPRFMSHVLEVRDIGGGKSHWKVTGPAGSPVEWDAAVTNLVPQQLLAWESTPGSSVMHSGLVRLAPTDDGGTHLNVQMSYTPPGGVIGHAVASFFGVNPKQAMDDDLLRLKSLIERGGSSIRETATVDRSQVENRGHQGHDPLTTAYPAADRGDAGMSERAQRGASARQAFGPPAHKPGGAESRDQTQSGLPGGGVGRSDEVGPTGVYPASGPQPEGDAPVQGMASWGQGERGAAGYEDHGASELTGLGEETDLGSVIPGQPEEPDRD